MSTDTTSASNVEWYADWFSSDYYLALYSHRDRAEAELCVDLVMRATRLQSHAEIPATALDVCCGAGRHAVVLAERGFKVTAFDLSPTLLAEARNEADRRNMSVEFHRRDMREITYVDNFDVATQLFTSFGYFQDPTDDKRVLRGVYRALHEGGYYILDIINPTVLKRTLTEYNERHLGPIHVKEQRAIVEGRVVKTIAIQSGHQSHEYVESVRLYTLEEITELLSTVGFVVEQTFGDYAGAAFDEATSERMILVSRADD